MRRAADGGWEVTGDRATHAAYDPPVGPASDYDCNTGTTLRAPWAGVVSTYESNTGGHTIVVDGDDATWFGQHNSAYYMTRGHADEGEPVAASGNTGSETTGPHSHQWVIDNNGNRWAFEEWVARMGGDPVGLGGIATSTIARSHPAGGGGKPAPDPYNIINSILKAGPNMKCMVIRNMGTGQIAFLIVGSEAYIFASVAEYNDFLTVLTTYNSMPDTPPEWKWPVLPPIDDPKRLLSVSDARFKVTLKALTVG